MTDWDGFRYFLALYRKGSLKQASQSLGVDQTTVGRRILALEESLGTKLFEKHSDGFVLTLAGERILPALQATEDSFLSIERLMAGKEERAEGVVKIALPGALANHWLIPRLRPFIKKHPGIELEFLTGAEVLNLARREADLAIRLVKPTQKDLIAKKLGDLELKLYAHPRLLGGKKDIRSKEDLEQFPFVGLYADSTSDLENLLLKKISPHLKYKMRSSAWSSVFYAVQSGLGVGVLPSFMIERESSLVSLSVVDPVKSALWLVVHPDIVQSTRVRLVIDFVSAAYQDATQILR